MKNMKKKVMIASFFAALMLMVPFTCIAEKDYVENLEMEQVEEESLQMYSRNDDMPGILRVIYTLAEELVEELLENGFEFGNNTEMVEEKIVELLTNEEELFSMGLTETAFEEILVSGEETVEVGSEVLMEATSEEKSASDEDMNSEVNMEAGETSGELEYVEMDKNIYVYLAGDVFGTNDSNELRDRLGWLNGVIEFIDLRNELKGYVNENLIPNVTWIEVISETLAYCGIVFDVEEFLDDLENYLMDIFEDRPLAESIIPYVIQFIYDRLNQKVGANMRQLWEGVRKALKTFIVSFFTTKPGIAPFKAFRKFLRATFKFGLIVGIMILYMNETQIQEYKSDLGKSIADLYNAWTGFFVWLETDPWLEPINIKGNVTGIEPNGGLWTYCEKDPDGGKKTNSDGYFEGVIFTTYDESYPKGIHKCVTTAVNNDTNEGKTVGNSGNKIYDLLLTGAFSGGNLTLTIDFSAEDNNAYVAPQNNDMTTQEQQQEDTVETTTQKTRQRQSTIIISKIIIDQKV